MKTQTLLEKAKAVQRKRNRTEPDADTLFAWLKGEITSGQICAALGKPAQPSYAYNFIVRSLKSAYAQGRIKLVEKP